MLTYYVDQLRGASLLQLDHYSGGEGPEGWYQATFSYKVNDEYYGGDVTIAGAGNSETPYRKGDKILVRYDPRRPSRNDPGIGRSKTKAIQLFLILAFVFALVLFAQLS